MPAIATVLLLSLAGFPQAIGQPKITKQPTSIAVALGGSATLQVTASATAPLTFQWQFNGADLTGAISNRLTPPWVIALPAGGASGVLELQWQGGSAPFRVQCCAELAAGAWQSDELSIATNATTVSSAPQQYFRVLQLGQ